MKSLLDYHSLRLEDLLTDEIRSALVACERLKTFKDGELIYSAGQLANDMLLIHSGGVRMSRSTADGRELILGILGPGHCVGLTGLIVGKRGQTATANEATTVGLISRASFDTILAAHPQLAVQLLPILASRLRAAFNFIEDTKRLPVIVHTAVVLEHLIDASEDEYVIDWSQSEVALAVGTSRVSAGKALKELEALGLIDLQYSRIKILDSQRLADWVRHQRNELL